MVALFQRSDCSMLHVSKMHLEDLISLFKTAQREDGAIRQQKSNSKLPTTLLRVNISMLEVQQRSVVLYKHRQLAMILALVSIL